jgi:hypothetical protein
MTVPRWFYGCVAFALIALGLWALREATRPSWVVLDASHDPETGATTALYVLDQRSGTWCVVVGDNAQSACHKLAPAP